MEVIGIPNSLESSVFGETMRGGFKKIGVEADERDVEACHYL